MNTNFQALEEEINGVQRDLSTAQAKKLKMEQTEAEVSERLREIMSKLMDAKVDERASERELKMRATLETLRRIFPGVHGRLVDLCRPTHRKYEQAISIALGRNIDAIVVDQEKTAIACIQYLREQRAGQATFIPLDTIQPSGKTAIKSFNLEGCRPVLEVIKFEDVYQRAFQYAIGSAVVCDTLEIAKELCYEREIRIKTITIDGTVIHKSGLMTGGVVGGDRAVAGRRWEEREVAKLKSERDSCLALIADTAKQLKRTETEERMKAKLIELQIRRRFLADELTALGRKLDGLKEEAMHIDQEQARCATQLCQVETSLGKHEKELSTWTAAINAVEDELFADFCGEIGFANIREFEASRLSLTHEIAEKRVQFTSVQSRLVHQIAFLRQQMEMAAKRTEELHDKMVKCREELEIAEKEQSTFFAQVEGKREALRQIQEECDKVKARLKEMDNEVHVKRTALTAAQTTLTAISRDVTTSECEIDRLLGSRKQLLRTCKMEEISLPMQNKNVNFLRDVDIDVDQSVTPLVFNFSSVPRAARNAEQMAIHERKYQEKLQQCHEAMDKLAPNLRALDKLEGAESRLKQSMESFERAKGDLRRAKENFATVRQKRYDRFNSAFKRISTTIDAIYKELTRSELVPTGGTAFLSLEDGEEPYTEGVRFHAMPPMKRFLDMDQLSGGERTVAALALLFAIHSYRPAPFFILDEIDAALDSANVMRVAAFIKARSLGKDLVITTLTAGGMGSSPATIDSPQSQNSLVPSTVPVQFLVISLKNSLYAQASALVGIYREPEERTSCVLTLRLSDYPE